MKISRRAMINDDLDALLVPGTKDIYAYRWTTTTTPNTGDVTESVWTGLCRLRDLRRFKDNYAVMPSMKSLKAITEDGIEMLENFGWPVFSPQLKKFEQIEFTDPFVAVEQGWLSAKNLVKFDMGNNKIQFPDGRPRASAILFDFSAGRVDSRLYDVDKAMKILSENPQVVFVDDFDGEPTSPRTTYARGNGFNFLLFYFRPTQEQYEAIYEECKRINSRYPWTQQWQAIFNLDLLGLRKAGAAKYDDWDGPYRSRCLDDEED